MTSPPLAEPALGRIGRHADDAVARIGAVDGLRSLAVVVVVAFHFGAPLPGGFLGVDLFFVISGFVITRLLMRLRADRSGMGYGRFLLRRIRRLLPVLVVVLVAGQLWLLTASDAMQRAGDRQTVAAALFSSNWYSIFGHQSYWDIHSDLTPLNHLWSLAVEEQFYLLWPFVLAVVLRLRSRLGRLASVLALSSISYGEAFLLGAEDSQRAYLGTDTRAGALLLGAALAVFLADRPASAPAWRRPTVTATWVGAASLAVFVAACAWTWTVDSPELYSGGLLAVGVAEVALVWSVSRPGLPARFFGSRPLRAIGRASYSIYLWHWLVWVALSSSPALVEWLRPVVAVGLTGLLSFLSYRFVEVPMRTRAPRATGVLSAIGLGAVAVFAILVVPAEPVLSGLPG